MVENEKIIGSREISNLFGLGSEIYSETTKFLKKQEQIRKAEFQKKFRLWESIFKNIYGKEIDNSLFLKHSYYALVLKILIMLEARILKIKTFNGKDSLPELEFFFCPDLKEEILNKIPIV